MDLERLPSGKFATNALILELGMIAYNILRMIGQGTIGGWAPRQKRDVKRRRFTHSYQQPDYDGRTYNHACTPVDNRPRKKQHLATYISDICQKYAVTNS